jgi:hypothetical protein
VDPVAMIRPPIPPAKRRRNQRTMEDANNLPKCASAAPRSLTLAIMQSAAARKTTEISAQHHHPA